MYLKKTLNREIVQDSLVLPLVLSLYCSELIKFKLPDKTFINFHYRLMFDQLMSQMEQTLSTIKTKKTKGPSTTFQTLREGEGNIDCTKTHGKVTSFPKGQRFKSPEKQPLTTTQIEWQQTGELSTPMAQARKFSFSKTGRFDEQRPKYIDSYINPDIDPIKKNTRNNVPMYRSPSKEMKDSRVSISTVDSETFRAPGLYNPKDEEKVKQVVFGKDGRFKQEKSKYEGMPIYVNESQTRKRPPMSAVMKKKVPKTRQLISKAKQEQLIQKLKLIYWKSIPLQIDRLYKNQRGAIIREDYFNLSKLKGTEKRSALLMMMDRMNHMRGGYEQDIQKKLDNPCGVVFRKSTPKPFKFSQMEPGPDYYSPCDDYVRANEVGFSFGREGVKQKIEFGDYRDYEIQEEIMKKGGNIVINPVHRQVRLNEEEIANLERGPGFYDCLFSQVEKRADVGVVKMQEITVKNDRENNCIELGEANDGIYFPKYTAIDANVPAPLLKQPSKVTPAHMPDKDLFPQHWLFYDGDLNKVRAELAKKVLLSKNMPFKEYQVYKDKFKRFKEYLSLQKHSPEAGEYEVQYKALDPHIANYEFEKQERKDMIEGITKPEGDVDGDNLKLNPKEIRPHLGGIDFGKMEGREELEVERDGQAREGDRLVINPKKIEKHVANVIFEKQEGRPEPVSYGEDENGPEGDVLFINPKPVEPHIANVDFARQADRKEIRVEQDQNQVVNVVVLKTEPEKVKGVAFSRLTSVKMIPLLRDSKLKPESE